MVVVENCPTESNNGACIKLSMSISLRREASLSKTFKTLSQAYGGRVGAHINSRSIALTLLLKSLNEDSIRGALSSILELSTYFSELCYSISALLYTNVDLNKLTVISRARGRNVSVAIVKFNEYLMMLSKRSKESKTTLRLFMKYVRSPETMDPLLIPQSLFTKCISEGSSFETLLNDLSTIAKLIKEVKDCCTL
ncbi:MAG: hypothetical protein N3E36_03330 [Sulfolobales archaeon]|nr:hypothetical protein [Sulfolobales archaeon]MCX8199047.1 hypothetical protein [Sulfolobales archaeon]MDW8170026.1 hypothetical protein [Desulfurococcaceae archaeon]